LGQTAGDALAHILTLGRHEQTSQEYRLVYHIARNISNDHRD
jgi:hypothetical protein